MKIKKSYMIILSLVFAFLFSMAVANALTLTLNSCRTISSVASDKNFTGTSQCLNATFAEAPVGPEPTNITQCVFSAVGLKTTITIGTNSTTINNITTSSVNASKIAWDTTASLDQNLTSIDVSCTINATGNTLTASLTGSRIDNTIPASTYTGNTPRSGSTIDDDYVIIETATDQSIAGCMLVINKTGDTTSTFSYFAPARNKCTTESQTATRGLSDDVTYSYHLRIDDGYNVSRSATRTFTTNIRVISEEPEEDDGGSVSPLAGGINKKFLVIGIPIAVVLIGAIGGFIYFKKK